MNTFLHPTKIGETESALLENYLLKEDGNVFSLPKRRGFQRQATGQLDGSTAILSLHEFTQQGQVDRIIANSSNGVNSAIKRINTPYTGTFALIATGGKYGNVLRNTVFNKKDYLTNINNGASPNEVYFYDTADRILEAGLPPCPQTFTLANGKSGLGTISNSRAYIITFIYDNKYESGIIPIGAIDSPVTYQYNVYSPSAKTGNNSILISSIPVGNVRVTARRIYATQDFTADGVTAFYYLDTINDNVTTDYEDITDTTKLVTAIDTAILYKPRMLGAKYSNINKNRLFTGYNTDTQYTAPTDTGVGLAGVTAGATLKLNTGAKYTYKFAYLYYSLNGATATWATVSSTNRVRWSNYAGIYSALSTGKSILLGAAQNSVDLTNIDNITSDTYGATRIITFRNLAFSVATVAKGATTELITAGLPHTSYLTGFKLGQSVVIEGASGTGWSVINGTHTITAVTNNSISINVDTNGLTNGNYTTHTAKVQGQQWYALRVSYYGDTDGYDFTDSTPDNTTGTILTIPDLITNASNVLAEASAGVVLPSDGNQIYGSRLMYSEIGEPDNIPATNYFDFNPDDGDEITGVWDDNDSEVIFKENNIHKLYLTSPDPVFWEQRKVVNNIGSTAGLQVKTPDGYVFIKMGGVQFVNIYEWDGGSKPRICDLKIRSYVNSLSTSSSYYTVTGMQYDRFRNWVWIVLLVTQLEGNPYEYVLIYDLSLRDESGNGEWYIWVNKNTRLNLYSLTPTIDYGIIFGNNIGYLYKYDEGIYVDKLGATPTDTAITSKWRSKTFMAEGDLKIKAFNARLETFGVMTSGGTIKNKFKVEDVAEGNRDITLTTNLTRHHIQNKLFTSANDRGYKQFYVGLEDSNTLFGHRLLDAYIDFDIDGEGEVGR